MLFRVLSDVIIKDKGPSFSDIIVIYLVNFYLPEIYLGWGLFFLRRAFLSRFRVHTLAISGVSTGS